MAIVVGVLAIACGLVPIILSRGVTRPDVGSTAPMWMGVAVCLVFIFGGFSVMWDYGVGRGRGSDGDLLPGTQPYVRVVDTLLGLLIVGLMAAMFAWVAFGSGTREFSSSFAVPFAAAQSRAGELPGRIAFGIGAVLFALLFIAFGISGIRRLRRALRPPG